jgi:hypothetical protein
MRRFWVILPALTAACSAAGAQETARYERDVQCEMLTALVGGFFPGLDRAQLQRLADASGSYRARTAQSGAALRKSEDAIEKDRNAYLASVQSRFRGPDAQAAAAQTLNQSDRCVADLG